MFLGFQPAYIWLAKAVILSDLFCDENSFPDMTSNVRTTVGHKIKYVLSMFDEHVHGGLRHGVSTRKHDDRILSGGFLLEEATRHTLWSQTEREQGET